MGSSSDFPMGSNGNCFFCLNQIMDPKPPQTLSSSLAPQTNSLQYLTRYLKMDLRKVFIDKKQVSPELLATVEKDRLKVELCGDCRCLNERFSQIYRHLEKLELELGSTLSLIHGRLVGADATGKLLGLSSGLNSNYDGSMEVLHVLRAEAIQKSSHKLYTKPRVKIQHVTKTEIQEKQSNIMGISDKESLQTTTNANILVSYRGVETSNVKMESPNEIGLADNENGNYFYEDADANPDSEPMIDHVEIKRDLNEDVDNIVLKNMTTSSKKVASRTTRNNAGTRKCSINPKTGKRKCKDCSKEFSSSTGFSLHYETVHLKLRYKCISCNKLFSQKGSLTQHQRTTQSCSVTGTAPKLKCHLCEKSFSLKHHLKAHLNGVHYKLQKYGCDLCKKEYNLKHQLAVHKHSLHKLGKANDK